MPNKLLRVTLVVLIITMLLLCAVLVSELLYIRHQDNELNKLMQPTKGKIIDSPWVDVG